MNENKDVIIKPIREIDKIILENIMTLYLHDLSEFAQDLQIDDHGKFNYDGLQLYFTDPALFPYFIYYGDNIAGFVLVNSGKYVPKDIDYIINEFFILKTYRKKRYWIYGYKRSNGYLQRKL